jgi:2-amino-4-hydroxy-6-hydroxymethyldihydropteridine diphosphokinase
LGGAVTAAAIALGSNLGDRAGHLRAASEQLRRYLADFRISSFHETEPVGVGAQPRFLNAAAVGATSLSPRELLDVLLKIEADGGRQRSHPGAARTLDLDLILFGDAVIDEPGLQVPHPRFRERRFVLEPLSEIAPDWRDPVSGAIVSELLAALGGPS